MIPTIMPPDLSIYEPNKDSMMKYMKCCLEDDPIDSAEIYFTGSSLIKAKMIISMMCAEIISASAYAAKYIQTDPSDDVGYVIFGYFYIFNEEYASAEEMLSKAFEIRERSETLRLIIDARSMSGKISEALLSFSAFVDRNESPAITHLNPSLVYSIARVHFICGEKNLLQSSVKMFMCHPETSSRLIAYGKAMLECRRMLRHFQDTDGLQSDLNKIISCLFDDMKNSKLLMSICESAKEPSLKNKACFIGNKFHIPQYADLINEFIKANEFTVVHLINTADFYNSNVFKCIDVKGDLVSKTHSFPDSVKYHNIRALSEFCNEGFDIVFDVSDDSCVTSRLICESGVSESSGNIFQESHRVDQLSLKSSKVKPRAMDSSKDIQHIGLNKGITPCIQAMRLDDTKKTPQVVFGIISEYNLPEDEFIKLACSVVKLTKNSLLAIHCDALKDKYVLSKFINTIISSGVEPGRFMISQNQLESRVSIFDSIDVYLENISHKSLDWMSVAALSGIRSVSLSGSCGIEQKPAQKVGEVAFGKPDYVKKAVRLGSSAKNEYESGKKSNRSFVFSQYACL